MNFCDFKKYLNNKDIYLYDSQYRISYIRFFDILTKKNLEISKFNILTNNQLSIYIESLLSKDNNKLNYIFNLLV